MNFEFKRIRMIIVPDKNNNNKNVRNEKYEDKKLLCLD